MNQQQNNLINDSDLLKVLKIDENTGRLIIPSIKYFLNIIRVNRIYKELAAHHGLDFVNAVLNRLNINYKTGEDWRKLIPPTGPFIIISNHPWGGIEGLILLKLICELRPDFKIQGNFLLHHIEPVREFILEVNPFEKFKSASSSYKGLKKAFEHLNEGNGLGIFPAGEVSSFQFRDLKVTDRQWQKSSVKFIQKAGVPIIPVCFHGYNSTLFYLLGSIHPLFRTARLPSELLNKSNKELSIEFRNSISPRIISKFVSVSALTHYLRAKTYLPLQNKKIDRIFQIKQNKKDFPPKKIVDPVDPNLLHQEISRLKNDHLLLSQGNYSIYCASIQDIPNLINEIGRLREITFREIGEGTNKSLDLDNFDLHYYHLILWDNYKNRLAGSYRIGLGREIINNYGKKGFYLSSLFKFKNEMIPLLRESLELGRSFIISEYQRLPLPLALLWKGILIFLKEHKEYKYLIGPVSISNAFSSESKSLIIQYIKKNHFDKSFSEICRPRKKFNASRQILSSNDRIISGMENSLKAMDLYINDLQNSYSIPVLLKKYLQLNGKVICFNVDPDFNNCLDALIIVKIKEIPERILDNLCKNIENDKVDQV